MTLLTHMAGAETANEMRRRLDRYQVWSRLVAEAIRCGVPISEPYPPTPVTPSKETDAMIARLTRAIEERVMFTVASWPQGQLTIVEVIDLAELANDAGLVLVFEGGLTNADLACLHQLSVQTTLDLLHQAILADAQAEIARLNNVLTDLNAAWREERMMHLDGDAVIYELHEADKARSEGL